MEKFTVEVLKTVVAHVEVDAESAEAAVVVVRQMNADGLLAFFDPELEDDYEVVACSPVDVEV